MDEPLFSLTTTRARFNGMKNLYQKKTRVLDSVTIKVLHQMKEVEVDEVAAITKTMVEFKKELSIGNIGEFQKIYREDEILLIDIQIRLALDLLTKINKRLAIIK